MVDHVVADGDHIIVNSDAEIVMFSPKNEHSHVINHMIEKATAGQI